MSCQANADRPALLLGRVLDISDLLVPGGLLAGVFLASAIVIILLDRWRKKRTLADLSNDDSESLTSFRAMYDRGELTKEEYEAVRMRLAERIKMRALNNVSSITNPKKPPPSGPEPPEAAEPAPAP